MNTESKKIKIYEWLEEKPFSALNKIEQEIVLSEMSEEEYEETFMIMNTLNSSSEQAQQNRKQRIKDDVMSRFETKHKKRTYVMALNPIHIGGIAASLAIIAAAFIWLSTKNVKTEYIERVTEASTDTIYQNREVMRNVVDTLYVYREVDKAVEPAVRSTPKEAPNSRLVENNSLLHIASVNDLDKAYNSSKKVSVKDDELVSTLGFVRL